MRVVVTGANGYFGRVLVDTLAQSSTGYDIVALVRNVPRFFNGKDIPFPPQVQVVDVDEMLAGTWAFSRNDVLCHLAAGRDIKRPEDIVASLDFTRRLFVLADQAGVRRVLTSSSQAVYGVSKPLWSEDASVAPVTIYGMAKYAKEMFAQNFLDVGSESQWVSLRISKLVGPSKCFRCHFSEPPHLFARYALRGESVLIPGDGSELFDLMDVRDAAAVVSQLVELNRELPPVLNVGSGKQISLREIAELTAKVSEKCGVSPFNYRFSGDAGHFGRDFGMNTSKLGALIKVDNFHSLERTTSDIFDFMSRSIAPTSV